tara:strand:- start:1393 stop:1887 length:495 start_codon:yes stop_codon:yes gene_type:complete
MAKNHAFSKISNDRLNTCHNDLIQITKLALELSPVDFGISQGERTIEQQQHFFDTKVSRINPSKYSSPRSLAKDAKHITIKEDPEFNVSRAVDVFAVVTGQKSLAFDHRTLSVIAGCFYSAAQILFDQRKTTHVIRWGGDWDSDGIIVHDQNLVDLPHYELIKK